VADYISSYKQNKNTRQARMMDIYCLRECIRRKHSSPAICVIVCERKHGPSRSGRLDLPRLIESNNVAPVGNSVPSKMSAECKRHPFTGTVVPRIVETYMKVPTSFANYFAFMFSQTASRLHVRAASCVFTLLAILPTALSGQPQKSVVHASAHTPLQAYMQFTPSEVARIDWGSGESQLGLLKVPGETFGPQSFAVDESQQQLYILDSTNNRILIYGIRGGYVSSFAISERADDLAVGPSGEIYVLYRGKSKVIEYALNRSPIENYPLADTQSPITGIHFVGNQGLFVETADEHSYALVSLGAKVGEEARSIEKVKGLRRRENFLYLERSDTGEGSISFLDSIGQLRKRLAVKSKQQRIETLSLVGLDDEGNYYLDVEESSDSMPTSRFVREYDSKGTMLSEAMVPYSAYAYTFKDLRVTGDGRVYQILPLKGHVEILIWKLNAGGLPPPAEFVNHLFSDTTVRPQDFIRGDTRPEDVERSREVINVNTDAQPAAQIAASSVLSRAESYRTHVFTVTSSNIASGNGKSCGGGKTVQTPTYITSPGSYTAVPYKWGGFSGLTGVTSVIDPSTNHNFDEGLSAGEYAGDVNTTGYGSSCAAGVDCAGFISQLWGLTSTPGVSGLQSLCSNCCLSSSCSSPATPSYPSYLLPGDILASVDAGHVMLFDVRNADGTFTVYESSAWGWKVATNSHAVSYLTSNYYYPYRGPEVSNSLQAGSAIQTSDDVNVRPCAGTSTSCSPICTAAGGSVGTLIGAPQDVSGYIWWQVAWNTGCAAGSTGWSIACLLQPYTAPALPTITAFDATPLTVSAGGNVTYTVTLSGPAPAGGATIDFTSSAPSVIPSTSVTILAGATSGQQTATALNVQSLSTALISANYNGSCFYQARTITVNPVALPTVSSVTISPSTVTSGSSAQVTVTLTGPAPSGGAYITLSSTNSSAFPAVGLTVAAGQTSNSSNVTAGTVTSSATATVTAGYNNSSKQATVTVNPVATNPTVSSVTISPSTVTSGSSAQVTVTLTGPAPSGGAYITLSSTNSSAFPAVGFTVAAGQTSNSSNVTAGTVTSSATATVTAGYNNSSKQATVTVNPVTSSSTISIFTATPTPVNGGAMVTFSVTLSAAAPTGGALIVFNSTAPSIIPYTTLLISAGATSGQSSVVAQNPASATLVTITASYGSNTKQAAITVNPVTKATPTVTVLPTPTTITTAQQLSVQVTVNATSGNATPTGFVYLSVIGVPEGQTLVNGTTTYLIPAGTLPAGVQTLTATYTPDSNSSSTYTSASQSATVTVTTPSRPAPTVNVIPTPTYITTSQPLSVTVLLTVTTGSPIPTGSVSLSATNVSQNSPLSNGSATFAIAAGVLPIGNQILTATYTPDTNSSTVYSGASGSNPVSVTAGTTGTGLTEPVGTSSGTQTANIQMSSSNTLGSMSAVTQGATGLDFAIASGGTCAVGNSYSAGQTCTVDYTFTPTAPGQRLGSLLIADGGGNVVATQFISGTGVGPQEVMYPGTQTLVVNSGLSYPRGIAMDGNGNIYIADSGNNRVVKETLSGGTYLQSKVWSGLNEPIGVAVDGGGSVYIADTFNNRVLKEMPSAGGYVESTVGSGLNLPYGVAVDGSGNVLIADTLNKRILQETFSGGSYTQSVAFGSNLSGPEAVAVDGSGNVYIVDSMNNVVLKETLSGSGYTESTVAAGLITPQDVFIDGGGSLYITNGGASKSVLKETPSGGNYIESVVIGGGIGPGGLAMDGSGNLYIADTYGNSVRKLDLSDPPTLNFASTAVGLTSSDSPQTITLWNIGNASLTFPIPASGTNPSISTNFSLDTSGSAACPQIGSSAASAGALAAGTSCTFSINFVPSVAGSVSGSLVLNDNNLNGTNTNQTISLNGTGTGGTVVGTTTVLGSSQNPSSYSQSVMITATVAATSGTATPTGTVQFSVDGSSVGSVVTLSSGTATYTTSTLAAGTHSITAVYSPGTGSSFTTSSATVLSQTVTRATPSVTAWPTANSITYGQTLASSMLSGGASTPAGSFAFTTPTTKPGAGAASQSVTFTPTDATDYSTLTGTASVTVNKASSSTALVSSLNPSIVGQSVNLTATVTGQYGGIATGTVTFSNGSTSLGGASLSGGSAVLATTALPLGTDSITAVYGGDSSFTGSTSNSVSQVVNQVPNPAPVISGISPGFVSAGGAAFTLTVNGSGFTSGSTVYWGTSTLVTTYGSATQLTAQVTAAEIANGGITVAITVQTPSLGGGTSNSFQFEVNSASGTTTGPTFTSTTATVTAGSPASYPVTLPSSVASASVTCLNLPTGATCSYSVTTNTVTITTTSASPKGTYQITVVFTETVSGAASGWILLPILLLPLMFLRRRLSARGVWVSAGLGLVMLAGAAVACVGCSSGGGGTSSTPPPQTHQVVSSGTVSLIVQ
jgi:sugar lactone lactonase YvrE